MAKQPHNEHELELALVRLAGPNVSAVEYRDIMAGVRLSQTLQVQEDAVVAARDRQGRRLGCNV